MSILVVEDDAISRRAVAEALLQEGYEVTTAANGREALEILARGDSRLVITDWMMPEVNGLDLCRAIRSGNFGGYTYVILISSLNDPRDAFSAISSGADDFMSKPWDRLELLDRVQAGERALQAASLSPAIEEAAGSRSS